MLIEMIRVMPVILSFLAFSIVLWAFIQSENKSFLNLVFSFGLLILSLISFIKSEVWQSVFVVYCCLLIVLLLKTSKKANKHVNEQNKIVVSDLIEEAKMQERSRIYANLHDDVGAKLLQLIYQAPDDSTRSMAKSVLQTLRTSVASTENVQFNVQQLAQNLCEQIQSQLNSHSSDELISSFNISNPNKTLPLTVPMSVLRIFREVCNNAIKHANSASMELDIYSDSDTLRITFNDNGKGMEGSVTPGKGLSTIKKRAESINAEVIWRQGHNKGTEMQLIYEY